MPNASVRDFGHILKSQSYAVFVRDNALYAFKGIAGRFSPIAVHVSLLLILGGAAFGALAGFDGQVRLQLYRTALRSWRLLHSFDV